MKIVIRVLCILLLISVRLTSGEMSTVEASAHVVRDKSPPSGGLVEVTFRILITNRGDALLRLPTTGYAKFVDIEGGKLCHTLEWSIPDAEIKAPMIVSLSSLAIVELRRGESMIIVLETPIDLENLDRPKEVRLVVTKEFGERYGVTSGSWIVPCVGPGTIRQDR